MLEGEGDQHLSSSTGVVTQVFSQLLCSCAVGHYVGDGALLTSGGIIPLLDGGITTLRSGLRFPIPMFPPGGGGDLVGMTFPRPFPLGVPKSPGEPLGLTKPFPAETQTQTPERIMGLGPTTSTAQSSAKSPTNKPFQSGIACWSTQR